MPEERGGPLASADNTQIGDPSGAAVPGASISGCGSIEIWVLRRIVPQPRHILLAAPNAPCELPLRQGLHGLGGAHDIVMLYEPQGYMTVKDTNA